LLAVVPQFLNLNQPLPLQYLVIGLTLSLTDFVVGVHLISVSKVTVRIASNGAALGR